MEREDAEFIVQRLEPARRDLAVLKSFVSLYRNRPDQEGFDHLMAMIQAIGTKLKEVDDDAQQYLDNHPSEGLIDDDHKYDIQKKGHPIFKSHG